LKEELHSLAATKSLWLYHQSAVIPFQRINESVEILLITSSKGKRWLIPKGIIESDMSPQDSAANEAFEEAGIAGVVYPDMLGSYTYEKWGGLCSVEVYLMHVETILAKWLEEGFRQRLWVPVQCAGEWIENRDLLHIIAKVPDFLVNYEDCET